MILNIRASNSYVFSSKVELSLVADMREQKFAFNVNSDSKYNILKTVGIYGPNNSGKTCLLKCIRDIRETILNRPNKISSNLFSETNVAELGITFISNMKKYAYDFKYDTKKNEYTYEKFSEFSKDKHGNEKETVLFMKDTELKSYKFESNPQIEDILRLTSKSNILIHLIDATEFEEINRIKEVLISLAESIEYVDMNNIPMQKTINIMKNHGKHQEKIVRFIKNADLYMEDFKYLDNSTLKTRLFSDNEIVAEEKVLNLSEKIIDQIKLTSVYKGKEVPSMIFDSTGTKKIIALSSYIIDALENGKTLVIDELDSSIHFKLARAIVSMFNNELNNKAQMIFTVHDVNLMDCKKLFRKEQIWFVHKDHSGVYLYPLSDFKATDGVRGDSTNMIEKYKKGILGSLPEPELINILLELTDE